VSHFIDMREPTRPDVLHGEQIAVTTLVAGAAAMGDAWGHAGGDAGPRDRRERDRAVRPGAHQFGLGRILAESGSMRRGADALNHKISTRWDEIRQKLEAVLLPVGRLEAVA